MGRCFQGKAQTKWDKSVAKVEVANRTEDTFKDAQRDYLEAIANVKNLGNCLIRQLRVRSKPAAMPFDDCCDRRN
eukprot:11692614-Ditylum_brightwellii.AAC.1